MSYKFGSFYGSESKYTVQDGDSIAVTVYGIRYTGVYNGS